MSARARFRPWYRSDCPSARDHTLEPKGWGYYGLLYSVPATFCIFCGRVPLYTNPLLLFGVRQHSMLTAMVQTVYPLPRSLTTRWFDLDPPLNPTTESFLRLTSMYRMLPAVPPLFP